MSYQIERLYFSEASWVYEANLNCFKLLKEFNKNN